MIMEAAPSPPVIWTAPSSLNVHWIDTSICHGQTSVPPPPGLEDCVPGIFSKAASSPPASSRSTSPGPSRRCSDDATSSQEGSEADEPEVGQRMKSAIETAAGFPSPYTWPLPVTGLSRQPPHQSWSTPNVLVPHDQGGGEEWSGIESYALPSMGSWNHHLGTCKPCAFFHLDGCANGANCTHCHLCEPGEKKRRRNLRRSILAKAKAVDYYDKPAKPPPPMVSLDTEWPSVSCAALPSIGSEKHALGTCKPCAFLYKDGCANGAACEHCHLCEPREKQRRRLVKRSAARDRESREERSGTL